jgi:hypothetical protein
MDDIDYELIEKKQTILERMAKSYTPDLPGFYLLVDVNSEYVIQKGEDDSITLSAGEIHVLGTIIELTERHFNNG